MNKLLTIVSSIFLCSSVFAMPAQKTTTKSEVMTKEYCTSGKSGQEVSACLKEMRNSKNEKYDEKNAPNYKNNILKRCEDFSDPQKALCEARLKSGTTTGSVKSGGTLTELIVKEEEGVMEMEVRKDHLFKHHN